MTSFSEYPRTSVELESILIWMMCGLMDSTPSNSLNLPDPDCTAQYTGPTDPNQQICVHTDIAHQTKGPGLFTKHTFVIQKQSLQQDSNPTLADYGLTGQNTGDLGVTSLSVSVAGVSVPLTLSPALPLQPGSTISGTSVLSLQSIPLVVGTAYPVAVTATFADGTSVTNSTSVVYSLP